MDIVDLEARVEELIALCDHLKRKRAAAEAERDQLREQKDQAKRKVEAMIARLKALKQG